MNKGFTLTELLVTLTIFLIITTAVYSGFNLSQKAYSEGQNSVEITQNGRVVMERIAREVRQAKRIIGDFPNERESALNEIFFEDGHILEPYHYIHYFKDNQEVKRQVVGYYFSEDLEETLQPREAVPPGGQTLEEKTLELPAIVGEWVNKLEFWGSEGVINMSLILEKKDKTFNLETRIFPRNF